MKYRRVLRDAGDLIVERDSGRGFILVGDAQGERLRRIGRATHRGIVHLDGDIELIIRLVIEGDARLQMQFEAAAIVDDLELIRIRAGQRQIVRAQGVVGQRDIGDFGRGLDSYPSSQRCW